MQYLFNQYYQCGAKSFHNVFQAFEEQIKTKHFPLYRIDEELVANIKHFKRPKNLSVDYIRSLMIRRLKEIRKNTSKLKLLYTGGTDSFTILKLCIENEIFVDEIATHMVSLNGDPKTNIEYLPGLKFAKQYEKTLIGKINIINPTLQDMKNKLKRDDWFLDCWWLTGSNIHPRPYSLPIIIQNNLALDEDTIVLTGFEKPKFLIENGQIYWTQDDSGLVEMSGIKNTIPFYLDKGNPELVVAMSYASLDCYHEDTLKTDQYLNFNKITNRNLKQKMLENIGLYSTGKKYIDFHLLGKKMFDQSIKTKRFLREIDKSDQPELVSRFFQVYERIYQRYKNLPYALEKESNLVKSVGRFSQKIPILQHKFGG